jgi:hypothetical protein
MAMDTIMGNPAALWPLGAVHDSWRWIDGSSAAMQAWIELQQALWQPWWDLQAEWLRQWGAASWMPQALAPRGAEQLG